MARILRRTATEDLDVLGEAGIPDIDQALVECDNPLKVALELNLISLPRAMNLLSGASPRRTVLNRDRTVASREAAAVDSRLSRGWRKKPRRPLACVVLCENSARRCSIEHRLRAICPARTRSCTSTRVMARYVSKPSAMNPTNEGVG